VVRSRRSGPVTSMQEADGNGQVVTWLDHVTDEEAAQR
jgi:hypothetical protein